MSLSVHNPHIWGVIFVHLLFVAVKARFSPDPGIRMLKNSKVLKNLTLVFEFRIFESGRFALG